MKRLMYMVTLAWTASLIQPAIAADNSVVRKMLAKKVTSELSSHNSQATAWHSSAKRKQQKWIKTKIFGQEIKTLIAEWTEETKSWVWLDRPDKTLSVNVRRLDLKDGRLYFDVEASAKARFKVWGKIPNVVTADTNGSCRVEITIAGSLKLENGALSATQISKADGKLKDLRFNNDVLRALQGLVQDSLNAYLQQNEGSFKKQLEKAINGTKV